jgi:peptidoglycan-N-acetylglucosamine deacetylase
MPPAALTTSWDDGHPLDLRLAALLREHNIPATFYIPRSAPSGTMTPSQIRELAESFEIGGHTLDHVFLTRVPGAEADRQIGECKSWVEQTTGKPCAMFCPPAGRFSPHHLQTVRDCGFSGVRTVELLSVAAPRQVNGIFVMPTTLQAHAHHGLAYARNAAKRGTWANFWQYIIRGCPSNWEQLVEPLLQKALTSGGVFHLWGHSWELELNSQWERLARVLSLMNQVSSEIRRSTNGQLCQKLD